MQVIAAAASGPGQCCLDRGRSNTWRGDVLHFSRDVSGLSTAANLSIVIDALS